MIGTLAGLVAAFVALSLVTVAGWLLIGPWGLVGAAALWAAAAALLIAVEVLYARSA